MANHGFTDEELDALTPEERAGLEEEGGAEDGADANDEETGGADDQSGADEETGDDKTKGEGETDDPDADKADDKAKGEEGEADAEDESGKQEQAETRAQHQPLIRGELPEDYDDQLKSIAQQRRELRTKFTDGEIDEDAYFDKLDELEDKRLDLRLQKERADLSQETAQQQALNDFNTEAARFLDSHPEIRDDQDRYDLMDTYLRQITGNPENWQKMSAAQMFEEAHARYKRVLGVQDEKAADKDKMKREKPEAPKTLANVPPAEVEETGNGKWSQLSRLLNSNDPNEVVKGEDMLAGMPEDEQDRYLAANE